MEKSGTLYLCGTPIGNLGDMTYRAVQVLKSVSLIAAEDTRHTRKLLSHFDIHVRLVSYHEHNKTTRGRELIQKLLAGKDIAVVSDAGMPGISDPGTDLVKQAIEAGLAVVPVPGVNAALTALVASGLDTSQFLVAGFLPKAGAKRRGAIAALTNIRQTFILYESPHHLLQTLKDLAAGLGDRKITVARELTKIHEEFLRGQLSEMVTHYQDQPPRGEFTVVVEGCPDEEGVNAAAGSKGKASADDESIRANVHSLISEGVQKKDAIRMTASRLNISRRRVYQIVLNQD